MSSFSTNISLSEFEDISSSFAKPVQTSVMPRWQRKQQQAVTKTSSSSSSSSVAKTVARTPRKALLRKRSSSALSSANTPTPKKASSARKRPRADRFIPSRSAMNMDSAEYHLSSENSPSQSNKDSPNTKQFKNTLENQLVHDSKQKSKDVAEAAAAAAIAAAASSGQDSKVAPGTRVLAFRQKAPPAPEGYENALRVLYSQNRSSSKRKMTVRHIPSAPERILDAPDLLDDYYLNLIDWSAANVLAVCLGQTVYLWNATDGSIDELMTLEGEDDYVSSVSWVPGDGNFLAVGTNNATVALWDVHRMKQLRTLRGHEARVSSLSWNRHILSSGGRDSRIINHDVRIRQNKVSTLLGHQQEVCGLKWSHDGLTLASGGNDNLLCLWDARASGIRAGSGASSAMQDAVAPRLILNEHQAAVKALAWCPFQRNVLASGGGTADRTIKFWNAATGSRLTSIDTGSQVCSLVWSPHDKEILSSHGFSQNQLCLWKYPTMEKVKELTGHTARVLHLAASPDGQTVCSAAADETLRFWKVFGGAKNKSSKSAGGRRSLFSGMNIR